VVPAPWERTISGKPSGEAGTFHEEGVGKRRKGGEMDPVRKSPLRQYSVQLSRTQDYPGKFKGGAIEEEEEGTLRFGSALNIGKVSMRACGRRRAGKEKSRPNL